MIEEEALLGEWINQNGSTLRILEVEDASIKAVFESKKGRAARGKEYKVVGSHNGEILCFIVNFTDADENLHAMTCFNGRIVTNENGDQQIHTLWVLTRQFEDEARSKPTQVWNSFLINTDVFTRTTG
jgi:hypothetical protein|tara:strand:+ start:1718 stop:2101 length:384 start_codon:yes stop_codon:yes gene_type:complete